MDYYPHDAGDFERERQMSPMEKMHRDELKEERRVDRIIHQLHDSLPAKSEDIQLFTFAERKQWGLRVNARRSFPRNNDHEQDGA